MAPEATPNPQEAKERRLNEIHAELAEIKEYAAMTGKIFQYLTQIGTERTFGSEIAAVDHRLNDRMRVLEEEKRKLSGNAPESI